MFRDSSKLLFSNVNMMTFEQLNCGLLMDDAFSCRSRVPELFYLRLSLSDFTNGRRNCLSNVILE